MRTRWLGTLTAVVLVVPALAEAALDAPHDKSFSDGNCSNCHSLYVPDPGAGMDFSSGCYSCHNNRTVTRFGKWVPTDQASPGFVGNHHSWSGYAQNPAKGAVAPSSVVMSKRLVNGRLQCATCHDAHDSRGANVGWVPDVSIGLNTAVAANKNDTGGAVGGASLTVTAPGTAAKGYRLKIVSVDGSGGTFAISHDFGVQSSTWTAAIRFNNGAEVALDDPAVKVKWTAGANPGDYWDFYVSYPFLWSPVAGDALCLICHRNMSMGHLRVSGSDPSYLADGTRVFSHPIGEALNANGANTDRTVDNPDAAARELLDASGVPQSTGDGDASNDLKLEAGKVRCTTCHAVHNADSNSLTHDNR